MLEQIVKQNGMARLQKTSLTTLGIFLDGFFVSPAVIPRLSVPPTTIEKVKCDLLESLPITYKQSWQ